MNSLLLQALEELNPTLLPEESLAYYAYALGCCIFPASVNEDSQSREIAALCERKIRQLKDFSRLGHVSLKAPSSQEDLFRRQDYSHLSVSQLVSLHAMSDRWYAMRRAAKMEPFTRVWQWRIVNELTRRDPKSSLGAILLLAECLEADNYARSAGLPYKFGQRPELFNPADYDSDEALVGHIRRLTESATWISHEMLVDVADHIQATIVEAGTTVEHLPLVNAILSAGMPCFSYPKIVQGLEKATRQLSKTKSKTRLELAQIYNTLWSMTLKTTYLHQFTMTVKHCYLTLANGKSYPDLGIDRDDPRSLALAIKFLDLNRPTLRILSDRYDLDPLLRHYGAVAL